MTTLRGIKKDLLALPEYDAGESFEGYYESDDAPAAVREAVEAWY